MEHVIGELDKARFDVHLLRLDVDLAYNLLAGIENHRRGRNHHGIRFREGDCHPVDLPCHAEVAGPGGVELRRDILGGSVREVERPCRYAAAGERRLCLGPLLCCSRDTDLLGCARRGGRDDNGVGERDGVYVWRRDQIAHNGIGRIGRLNADSRGIGGQQGQKRQQRQV